MADYAVEKGVPMPANGARRPARYPFSEMEIGDSFFVPLGDEPVGRLQRRIATSCAFSKRRGKGEFATRAVEGGVRVWRTA